MIGFVDKAPGCHTYVFALAAVIVVDAPAQRVVAEADVLTEGNGLTVIVRVAVFVQPVAVLVPVTVYVVVATGITVIGFVDKEPGCQI